jgi:hypothetical protein
VVLRLATVVAFSLGCFACSHLSPPAPASSQIAPPELGCRRPPAELWVPVETQAARLSICAQLPADRSVLSTAGDDSYTLMFATGEDGSVREVGLLARDGRPLGGRIAECFSGVMTQVTLGPALGGTCAAAVPIRVSRSTQTHHDVVLASMRR